MAKAPIFIYGTVLRRYQGHFLCQTFALGGIISGLGGSATNAAIAYDRFRCEAYTFFALSLLIFPYPNSVYNLFPINICEKNVINTQN